MLAPFTLEKFKKRVFGQLWMLGVQFLLGMLLNLIGSEAKGFLHTVYIVVLALHILNALGLVEGGIYIALKEKNNLAWRAAIVLSLTLVAGLLTMSIHGQEEFWSFIMAAGFLISVWLNGMLYLEVERMIVKSHRH